MADPFQPRFVDLVRNFTTTTGTGNFVPGAAVAGFRSLSEAVAAGDQFYYCVMGIDKPAEREVGRGTMMADGSVARQPIGGAATNFTTGNKTLSLVAAAEWFDGAAQWVTPQMYGAKADGITDDAIALQAWLDHGGELRLPAGHYRSSQRLLVRRQVVVKGDGWSFDARQPALGSMAGSRISFAAGAGGFLCQMQTTESDTNTAVAAGVAGFTQEGSTHSHFEGFGLIGGGGGTATGFESRTTVSLRGIRTYHFGGCGFDVNASADVSDPGSDYGNASLTTFDDCAAIECGSHGFRVRGRDAGIVRMTNCNAQLNGGWGFVDESTYGGGYYNCHAATNTAGSFKSLSPSASTTYENCYVEGGVGEACNLHVTSQIVGGNLLKATNVAVTPAPRFGFGTFESAVVKLIGNQVFPGPVSGAGYAYHSSNLGLVIYGEGSNYDLYVANKSGNPVFTVSTGTQDMTLGGNLALASGKGVSINGQAVLGARGAAVADATDAASAITQLNALLARCRAHGLIARAFQPTRSPQCRSHMQWPAARSKCRASGPRLRPPSRPWFHKRARDCFRKNAGRCRPADPSLRAPT